MKIETKRETCPPDRKPRTKVAASVRGDVRQTLRRFEPSQG
jgi:hypothetical protein